MPLAKAKITDYLNPTTFSKVIDLIDDNDIIQDNSNEICGNEKTTKDSLLMGHVWTTQ
jgi:hypothetical protein